MADRELDLRGLTCPLPVLRAHKALKAMARGQQLAVLASDPKAPDDFVAFCAEAGHRLLVNEEAGGAYRFLVERG